MEAPIAIARTCNTMLNKSGKSGHLVFSLIFEERLSAFHCWLWYFCRLVIYGFSYLEVCSLYTHIVESFFLNHKWVLNFLLIPALRFYLESLSLSQVYTNIYLYIVYKNLTYQFIQSLIHLCNKHLLNTDTLGIVQNAGNKATNKTKFLAIMELYSKRNMIIQDII